MNALHKKYISTSSEWQLNLPYRIRKEFQNLLQVELVHFGITKSYKIGSIEQLEVLNKCNWKL